MKTLTPPPLPVAATVPAAAPALRLPWTSPPRRLQLAALGLCVASLALFLGTRHVVRDARAAVQSIGRDCAPSIVAAERIRAAVADLDANLVNLFLCPPGTPARRAAERACAQRRVEIADSLVRAAGNITFGEAERVPLTTLARDLGPYEAAMARALALEESGNHAGAVTEFRRASDIENQSLLPAADALAKTNFDVLQTSYDRARTTHVGALATLLAVAALGLGALGLTQVYVARRSRRLLNLGLLAATLVAAALSLGSLVASVRVAGFLRAAKEDAFDSVFYLWKARALTYDVNGQESRWLYDREHAAEYEAAFRRLSAEVVTYPAGRRPADLAPLVPPGFSPTRKAPEGWSGLLVNELCNITFVGEREVATETLALYGSYLEADTRLRALENGGNHVRAVALCLSTAPDGSNGIFARFDEALGRTLGINETAFEEDVVGGFHALDGFDALGPLAALGIAAASVLGLWPRIREYAA